MIHIQSLNQRIALFLILPVTILLLAMGAVAFGFARNVFLEEWTDATILRLQRAAHHVDMRLDAPKKWMRIYQEAATSSEGPVIQTAILQQLRALAGVADVRLVSAKASGLRKGRNGGPGRPEFRDDLRGRTTAGGDRRVLQACGGPVVSGHLRPGG